MGSVNDNIRNVKRAYRKKAFQTGYSVAGDSVEATPVPQHTYSTTTTQQTSVVRPGLDARTYLRGDGKDGHKPFTRQELIKFSIWLDILGL